MITATELESRIAERVKEAKVLADRIKEEENTIAQFEAVISKNNLVILRKQGEMDQVNKKIGVIMDKRLAEGVCAVLFEVI